MKKNYVKKLCVCSVMSALFVALEYLSALIAKLAFMDGYQIPISCFPLILASIMFGVRWGAFTAIVGSFVSQLILPYGISWSTLIWMAPTVIYGIIVATLYLSFKKSNNPFVLTFEFFVSSIILSSLNIFATFIDSLVTGYPYDFLKSFFVLFVSIKIIGAIIFAIIFAIITPYVIKRIKKTVKF